MLLNADGSATSLDILGEVEQMASASGHEVASTVTLQRQYEQQAKPVNALVASLTGQQAALNAQQKAQISKKIAALNVERVAAFGTSRDSGSAHPVACPQVYNGEHGSKPPRSPAARSASRTSATPTAPATSTAPVSPWRRGGRSA